MNNIGYSTHYWNWHSDTPEHIGKMDRFYQNIIVSHFSPDQDISVIDVCSSMGFLLLLLLEMMAGSGTTRGNKGSLSFNIIAKAKESS